jgi:hypothetical protein
MICISDIIADLSRASKSYFEIKEMLQSVYGDKALKKMAIYAIIKKVKNSENTDGQRQLQKKDNPSSRCLCRCHH